MLDYELLEGKSHARIIPVTLPGMSTMPGGQQLLPVTFCCVQMNERQVTTASSCNVQRTGLCIPFFTGISTWRSTFLGCQEVTAIMMTGIMSYGSLRLVSLMTTYGHTCHPMPQETAILLGDQTPQQGCKTPLQTMAHSRSSILVALRADLVSRSPRKLLEPQCLRPIPDLLNQNFWG